MTTWYTRYLHRTLSWALLSGGVCLLFLGARELISSRWDQAEAGAEWTPSKPDSSAGEAPLFSPPSRGAVFARLSVPRLDKDWYVVEGTGHRELRKGPGHMQGTPWPGAPGSCIIAGHRDTHFRALKDIRVGDEIRVDTQHGDFHYRVARLTIVEASDRSSLRDSGDATLKLITCYPFYWVGAAPRRFIVEAALQPGAGVAAGTALLR